MASTEQLQDAVLGFIGELIQRYTGPIVRHVLQWLLGAIFATGLLGGVGSEGMAELNGWVEMAAAGIGGGFVALWMIFAKRIDASNDPKPVNL